jgi:UDP-N-acetylglucosamine 2-epimerase (non-hydrolysing)
MKSIYLVAGARPNFMKIAPIVRALQAHGGLAFKIIHTGQHYDRDMNDVFFEELGIPEPDVFMSAGGGSHSQQTGKIMIAFEELCQVKRPDAVLVVGDVNSTLACSIVSKKLNIPVAHVEAGLRSGDMTMPEEINRLVTDSISDWFFVTEPSGITHLKREGKSDSEVHYVGHVMVDNLLFQAKKLANTDTSSFETNSFKTTHVLSNKQYGVITLHRPSNVDNIEMMTRICKALKEIANELPMIFPVHPRTQANLEKFAIDLGTDSGGLQEETTALGIPCITIRENTERPITVEEGSNVLVGTDPIRIIDEVRKILRGEGKQGCRPNMWDGKAAERIVKVLAKKLAHG